MTWEEVETAVNSLSAQIQELPTVIVAIARGGLVPARLLAKNLAVKEMYCLSVKKKAEGVKVITRIEADLSDKNVLLVEDVLESASSLIAGKAYLETLGCKVQTVALYVMPTAKVIPDYYVARVNEVPTFPWE